MLSKVLIKIKGTPLMYYYINDHSYANISTGVSKNTLSTGVRSKNTLSDKTKLGS